MVGSYTVVSFAESMLLFNTLITHNFSKQAINAQKTSRTVYQLIYCITENEIAQVNLSESSSFLHFSIYNNQLAYLYRNVKLHAGIFGIVHYHDDLQIFQLMVANLRHNVTNTMIQN